MRLHSRIYSFEDDIVNSFNYYEVRLDFFSFGTWAVRLISSENNTTYNTVVVNSANAAQGSVSGGGAFVTGTQRTISASPHTGYRFLQWNDGITTNPRSIIVTSDTSFTAYFEPLPTYTVTLLGDNEEWGTVDGGGTFTSGTTITIHATPNTGYHFDHWSNGNTQANTSLTVLNDITLTAYFAPDATEGINDVTDDGIRIHFVDGRIIVEGTADAIQIFDIMSRSVRNESLPVGVYLVKIGNHPAHKVVVIR